MNTIVMNTLTGAVSEYTGFGFQSITPTHAGSATGLFAFESDRDMGLPIVARIQTGKPQWQTGLKKYLDKAFFGLKGVGTFRFHVDGENDNYVYPIIASAKGESRSQPGRGIRETYLSYGFSNPSGQAFFLDSIEVLQSTSNTRRS